MNICSLFQEKAAQYPHKDALIHAMGMNRTGRQRYARMTYEELAHLSDQCAWGFQQAGIWCGTKTIILAPPEARFFPLIMGLFKVGAVPVVVDPGMGLGQMLRCLASVDAEAFVGIPVAQLLRILNPWYFRNIRTSITVGKSLWGGLTADDIIRTPWKPFPIASRNPGEPAVIIFTTGSTGPAKGVPYSHEMLLAQAGIVTSFIGAKEGQGVDLATFPIFALFDIIHGGTAVLPDMDFTKPAHVDPVKILGAIQDNHVTHMFASPALLNRVGRYAQGKDIRLPSMKTVLSGGAPVSSQIMERFLPLLPPDGEIFAAYGATECLPISSLGSREILSETARMSAQGLGTCVGKPFPGLEVRVIRITDDPIRSWSDDLSVPPGEIGELILRGPHVSRAYFKRPDADVVGKIEDGDSVWHRMGDVVWMDEEGRIWICGRKKHRVITRDKTLFTVPCEAIFNAHPMVARSALVGIGSVGDQKPVICVELEQEGTNAGREKLVRELLDLGQSNPITRDIMTILIYPGGFPVDIRHNAKIFREKLAVWAKKQLSTHA